MNAHYIPERFSNGVVFDHLISDGNLLPDQEYQDPCERSTVQKFTIGTRLVIGERAFRYGFFHQAVGEMSYALVNGNVIPNDGAEPLFVGTPLIGDRTIIVADAGSPANRPVNYYQGGYVFIYRNPTIAQSATNHDQFRRVVSSTVGTTANLILTLDYPLTCTPAHTGNANDLDIYPSQYSLICQPGHSSAGEESFVGFAHAWYAASEYGWVQTWGPVNAHSVVKFCGERGAPGDRDCYFTAGGGVATAKSASGTDVYVSFQRAGYLLPCTKSAYGSEFFMLQLAP